MPEEPPCPHGRAQRAARGDDDDDPSDATGEALGGSSCVEDVVSLVPQPVCQSAAGAVVDQELHRVSTETAASVSPTIAACA